MILFKKEHEKIINKSVFPGIQGGPLEHVIAAKAVALKLAETNEFKEYQKQVVANAKALANALIKRGFRLITNGTDNHLISIDLRSKNITGKEAEKLLDSVNITTNKESIPFDPLPPTETSGLRLGTPALTTRGMKEAEMELIADLIDRAISSRNDEKKLEAIRNEVSELTKQFPIYNNISYI
jgi:glycine hydroxymethyltransferase